MGKNILIIVMLLVLAGALIFIWMNWGPQLAVLPGLIASRTTQILTGLVGGLAGFGSAVADSFRGVRP